ncbi:MAG: hypothetical protein HPY85_13845 [Anaerolineae bacterium]|nr:hypothetical protein [Anaerolineae bacterium]
MAKHLKLRIPARINILGNPADANEGDFATISAAVNLHAYAEITPHDSISLSLCPAMEGSMPAQCEVFPCSSSRFDYHGDLSLIKAGIKVLHDYSPEFRAKYQQQGFHANFWTEVPRQSGLGGSSLFILLLLGGLRAYYELDPFRHNDYVLAELTQRAESAELGIACGFADRLVPLFGGIAYIDFRGKLLPTPVDESPYATYERLDEWVESLPLVLGSTGVQHDSGDVHGHMRPRYIEQHLEYLRCGGNMPPMVQWMSNAWETAWRGKIALLKQDWRQFGALMSRNHQLVNEMMQYCGFPDGAGWANNCLINAGREFALGAKLTGAGGGGSVFALTLPGEQQRLIDAWHQTATVCCLEHALIQPIEIAHHGLQITEVV